MAIAMMARRPRSTIEVLLVGPEGLGAVEDVKDELTVDDAVLATGGGFEAVGGEAIAEVLGGVVGEGRADCDAVMES